MKTPETEGRVTALGQANIVQAEAERVEAERAGVPSSHAPGAAGAAAAAAASPTDPAAAPAVPDVPAVPAVPAAPRGATAGRAAGTAGGPPQRRSEFSYQTAMPALSDGTREVVALAHEMQLGYEAMLTALTEDMGLDVEEALRRAEADIEPEHLQRLLTAPPAGTTWSDMERLGRFGPGLPDERWEVIKAAALAEIRSGNRSARALACPQHGPDKPWHRAQYLALRSEFLRQWGGDGGSGSSNGGGAAAGGIDAALIDQMALAYHHYLYWVSVLSFSEAHMRRRNDHPLRERGDLPEEHDQATEQATAMADRWNRMFLRTLRALRDMRRLCPQPPPPAAHQQVIVQQAGQVNLAAQQVNVAEADAAAVAPDRGS